MIERPQRPLIDRPRYVSKPPNAVNAKNLNKQKPRKKGIDKQMQQPVSGSLNEVNKTSKVKPPVKPKTYRKKKTKKPSMPNPPRTPKVHKEDKNEGSMFKQMKDKFIGNKR